MIVSFNKNVKYCSKECNEASKDERGIECMKMFKESYYNALNKAKELAENKSELSGKKGKLVVHHLNSYNKYLSGRCDVANMVVLLEEEHKAFHKKYGYGNNSVEQFEEFMQDYIHAWTHFFFRKKFTHKLYTKYIVKSGNSILSEDKKNMNNEKYIIQSIVSFYTQSILLKAVIVY